jgi:hypothetical protein
MVSLWSGDDSKLLSPVKLSAVPSTTVKVWLAADALKAVAARMTAVIALSFIGVPQCHRFIAPVVCAKWRTHDSKLTLKNWAVFNSAQKAVVYRAA